MQAGPSASVQQMEGSRACESKKRKECYERSDEMVRTSIKKFKESDEFWDIETLVYMMDDNKKNPFEVNMNSFVRNLMEGKVDSCLMNLETKVDLGDHEYFQYVKRPELLKTSEHWFSTDASNLDFYFDNVSSINERIPSVVVIANRELHVTTSQALIILYMSSPVHNTRTLTMNVDPKRIMDIAEESMKNPKVDEVVKRCNVRTSIPKGGFLKTHVLSVGTGCGKTMMACMATALCMIEKNRWSMIQSSFDKTSFEQSWSGVSCRPFLDEFKLLRCCIVFSPQNIFSQWSSSIIGTVKSLLLHMASENFKVYVWEGKTSATRISYNKEKNKVWVTKLDSGYEDYPKRGNFNLKFFYENVQQKKKNVALYWILPLASSSIDELQENPDMCITCRIFDEFMSSTKKRNSYSRSMCFGPDIITQATLESLGKSMAMDECHPLRVSMEGIKTLAPGMKLSSGFQDTCHACYDRSANLSKLVAQTIDDMKRHAFQSVFVTPYFLRRFLSMESRDMMMSGIKVYHVGFKNVSFASRFGLSNSDITVFTQEKFTDYLIASIKPRNFYEYSEHLRWTKQENVLTYESFDTIVKFAMDGVRECICKTLFEDLNAFYKKIATWISENEVYFRNIGKLKLFCNKMSESSTNEFGELTMECPICYEDVEISNVKMTSCCMGCVCKNCFQMCKACPFCRLADGVRKVIDVSMVQTCSAIPVNLDKGKAKEEDAIVDFSNLEGYIARNFYEKMKDGHYKPKNVFDVIEASIKILTKTEKPRIVLYFDYNISYADSNSKNMQEFIEKCFERSVKIVDMELVSRNVKKGRNACDEFHSDDPSPVVWICSSRASSATFAGLDLYDMTGMIVFNCDMDHNVRDQIMGRVTRMTTDPSRNKKYIPLIHIVGV